ncbi:MAG: SAM-dependent chlorinase/fluorinase [Planctomycetes bacterium]|nr:SAM-dependent chlorinase/fluorinase [Planctomycetota bacterium]
MSIRRPLITLLTDFGTADPYAAIVKGVILGRCPWVQIVDISHEVPPQNVRAAGHILSTSYAYFPRGSVHVAVVDPGVGSKRRILAASFRKQLFLAPDNGLLPMAFGPDGPDQVVSVENRRIFLQPVSRTFHGRDIFAPAAAHLARGRPLGSLGPVITHWTPGSLPEPCRKEPGVLVGEVITTDQFGNLVTNLSVSERATPVVLRIRGRSIRGLAESYASVRRGGLLAILGSTGRVEIAINQGSAKKVLGAREGTRVELVFRGRRGSP